MVSTPVRPAAPTAARTRGERAGLNVARIVQAARALDPEPITMQAVAARLGVDPKALRHHVTSREALLAMVASETFLGSFCLGEVLDSTDWRDCARAYARAVAEGTRQLGPLAEHLPIGEPFAAGVLRATETVLLQLTEAGLEDASAVRSLVLLTNTAIGYARDTAPTASHDIPTRPRQLRSALAAADGNFPTLERIAINPPDTYAGAQLEFAIDTILDGIDKLREPES